MSNLWLIILGAPVLGVAWFATFLRWQRGVEGLLIYLPFAGAVALWLAPNPAALLFKDFLFVIPMYLSFFLVHGGDLRHVAVPPLLTGILATLALIVLAQMFNPSQTRLLMAAVGAKVWLFYLPLVYLGGAMIRSIDDLVRLLRLLVAVSLVPCAIGLIQFALAQAIGIEGAVGLFYGAAAAAATSNFAELEYGGTLYRIPATFSFVTQYMGYTQAMIVPAYALSRVDPSFRWRQFARVMLIVIVTAGLLSGGRANFLFMPMLLAFIYLADARMSGALAAIVVFPCAVLAILWVGGLDPTKIYSGTWDLSVGYSEGLVIPDLIDAIEKYPLGVGTGMNTGPARHALSAADVGRFPSYEGYYAKAVSELGVPGLLIIVSMFAAVIGFGLKAHFAVPVRRLRSCSAAMVAFPAIMAIQSIKNWQIDIDPVNVYCWLFAGILFKLPYLAAERRAAGPAPRALIPGAGNIRWSARARRRA